jgi:hypothetical protein
VIRQTNNRFLLHGNLLVPRRPAESGIISQPYYGW